MNLNLENNLIETFCPLCSEEQQIKELYPQNFTKKDLNSEVFSARRTSQRCHYRIVKCKCGMIFSNPILNENIVNQLYEESVLTYMSEIENIQNSYLNLFKKLFSKNLQNLSVLEFGCGNGFFLKKLLEYGIKDVAGIEPSKNAVEQSDDVIKPLLINDFIENIDFKNKNFDVICSFQTLDHLRDPVQVLKKCHSLLKPDGACVFVMHDTNSLQARILKDRSPIIDIEHIFLFNKKTALKIFQKIGFKNIKVFDIKNSYSLEYWVLMLPFPKIIKNVLLKIISISGISKVNIKIKAGNMAVIGYK